MNNQPVFVVDEAIPFIVDLLKMDEGLGEVIALPASAITSESLRNVDALIVRSVTPVNENLLSQSRISFVGTATIGTDHLDIDWLDKKGIQWQSAPGCNALAVVQYVMSAIAWWGFNKQLEDFSCLTVGIIGHGEIGGRLRRLLEYLRLDVLVHDPLKLAEEKIEESVSLADLFHNSDIITCHVPLILSGKYKTLNMLDIPSYLSQASNKLLVNTSRGGIISADSLRRWKQKGGSLAIDVWPEEPQVDKSLVQLADIATSHIAGYSLEGKLKASQEVLKAIESHFGKLSLELTSESLPPLQRVDIDKFDIPSQMTKEKFLYRSFIKSYPIFEESKSFKQDYTSGTFNFSKIRDSYNLRRDYSGQVWNTDSLEPTQKKEIINLKHYLETLV
ncbi:4-phosphoerythronate dehydrogenase [Pleionea sediminis]|uniref:4-phosphoerythronate dehydrogenase n=1 Tax=Pleionea sediminis TaxID=2569479 RepID=UPI001184AE3A|nr:4-phosphoerythronate dehydrogenase [Pleionea sediminis]